MWWNGSPTVRAGFRGASQGSPAGFPSHRFDPPPRLRPCKQGYEIYSTRRRVQTSECWGMFIRQRVKSAADRKTIVFWKCQWNKLIQTPNRQHQELGIKLVGSSWNVMAHGDAWEGERRGNWRMEWVASTLHTTSEHVVSNITTADVHTSAVSSRLNWCPRWFKWTRPFRRKTKFGFCACAITFQKQSTYPEQSTLYEFRKKKKISDFGLSQCLNGDGHPVC